MKALQVVGLGQVALREVEPRKPESDEALVKIHAAALNHRDQWIREGKYPNIQFNTTLGSDGSGEVVETGSQQHHSWLGKSVLINPNLGWGNDPQCQAPDYQVLGMPVDGTLAEYITIPVDRLVEKPAHLSYSDGAAIPLAGLTAYRALFHHGQLKAGQQILITGIGGGVSQMAFLLAKALGAIISITSGSKEKLSSMMNMGAQQAYNYREEWGRQALLEGHQYDLVIDSAGGDQLNKLIKLVKPGGRIVFYGATTGLPPKLDLYRMFWNQITLQGSTMGNDHEFIKMVEMFEQNQLRPILDSERPFEQVIEAMDCMRDARQLGKLVVTF